VEERRPPAELAAFMAAVGSFLEESRDADLAAFMAPLGWELGPEKVWADPLSEEGAEAVRT